MTIKLKPKAKKQVKFGDNGKEARAKEAAAKARATMREVERVVEQKRLWFTWARNYMMTSIIKDGFQQIDNDIRFLVGNYMQGERNGWK